MLRISILMCGARNGGAVMSTRLWCIYWLKALSCLAKGRKDASRGEGYGGVVWARGYLGESVPFAVVGYMNIFL